MLKRLTQRLRRMAGNRPRSYSFDKQLLIDVAFGSIRPAATSMADLGGAHLVDGAYAFYALRKYAIERAYLVDFEITDGVQLAAQRFPGFKALPGAFDANTVLNEIRHVDVTLLFDVLLHQVSPDWHDILAEYATRTDCLVIHNPQWTAGKETVRLLDLGIDAYFENIPHRRTDPPYAGLAARIDDMHPESDRRWRDLRSFWQWGITDQDLIRTCEQLGFELKFQRAFGRFGDLKNFCRSGFIFTRVKAGRRTQV